MRISRRSLLIAGAFVLVPPTLLRVGTKDHLKDLLTTHFGAAIANHPETRKFVDVLAARLRSTTRTVGDIYFYYKADTITLLPALENLIEEALIYAFLTSTNVLAALDGKEPLEFSGLFEPYAGPCSNRLATTG